MSLSAWGWNLHFEALWNGGGREGLIPARVIAQHRKYWRVAGDFAECWAEAAGKLRLAADDSENWPAVGDWVAVERRKAGVSTVIQAVLPRRSQFVRKSPGKKLEDQVIAANIDVALLVSALDGDFNPRRLERYLAQCWESGARPVVVLNKADACEDLTARVAEVERVAMGTSVCVLSAKTGQGFDELESFLVGGQTVVLLGSSGVGKSTIVNRLLGELRQETREVRESDSRGRHTTTTRSLFALPGGALLLDTPGLRELQLWDAAGGIAQTFGDIDSLAAQCKFSDCRHAAEPGCAVLAALQEGTLDPARFENRQKLLREQEFMRRKMDLEARQKEKERVKLLHRGARQKYEQRERNGGKT